MSAATGEETPLWIHHSQGDQWDVMMLLPLGSYREYYHSDRMVKRENTLRDERNLFQRIADATACGRKTCSSIP